MPPPVLSCPMGGNSMEGCRHPASLSRRIGLLSSGFQVGTLVERLLPEIGVLMLVPCGKEACGLPQYPRTPLRPPFDLCG